MRKKKSKAQQANEFIDERARHYKKLKKILGPITLVKACQKVKKQFPHLTDHEIENAISLGVAQGTPLVGWPEIRACIKQKPLPFPAAFTDKKTPAKKRKKKNKKIKQRKPTPQNEHPLPDYHPNDIAKRWYGK